MFAWMTRSLPLSGSDGCDAAAAAGVAAARVWTGASRQARRGRLRRGPSSAAGVSVALSASRLRRVASAAIALTTLPRTLAQPFIFKTLSLTCHPLWWLNAAKDLAQLHSMLAVLVCAALVNRYGSNAHKSAALAPADFVLVSYMPLAPRVAPRLRLAHALHYTQGSFSKSPAAIAAI